MAAEQEFLPAARFKRLTRFFDAFVAVTVREKRLKRGLLERMEVRPGDRILDLGAGTATLAIMIKERWPDTTVVGLDADPEILALGRAKLGRAGVDAELVEGFSNALPFEDESFDVVVSTLFFHHLSGKVKRETAPEVARVLKPGGRFYVADWGKPADPLQDLLFLQARLFDGFEVTRDNRNGALPGLFEAAGLGPARVEGRLRTGFGTLEYVTAQRANGGFAAAGPGDH